MGAKVQQLVVEVLGNVAGVTASVAQEVLEAVTAGPGSGLVAQLVLEAMAPYAFVGGSYTPPAVNDLYRILVFDTDNNLVTVLNNVRSFSFKDVVNGGSAEGTFRINQSTALTNYSGIVLGNGMQYQHQNLATHAGITITKTSAFGVWPVVFSFTLGTILQQIVTITINSLFQVSFQIVPTDTTTTIATKAAAAINAYGNGFSATPSGHTVALSGPNTPDDSTWGITADFSQVPYQQIFQYNYRVQFYLQDSIYPWYDGRISGWDPEIPDSNSDDAYVDIHCEGWQNALNDGIVTMTLNPGLQPNGAQNPNISVAQLLRIVVPMFQNSRVFVNPIPRINDGALLYSMQWQGNGLAQVIDDTVQAGTDNTGYTYEWWVRGLPVGQDPDGSARSPQLPSVGLVVQANMVPATAPNGIGGAPILQGRIAPTDDLIQCYFVNEVEGQTCFNYKTMNTINQLYNMIALYGGTNQQTNVQAYGAYQDSFSISLYGLRQHLETNNNLLTGPSLQIYATAYLLLHAYPQPQTTYTKFVPTDAMRSGIWVSVLEQGSDQSIPQNLHQMRSISVECQLQEDQEKMRQVVAAAAPRPFVDHAFYGSLRAGATGIPTITGSTAQQNSYFNWGGRWLGFVNGTTQTKSLPAISTSSIIVWFDAGLSASGNQPWDATGTAPCISMHFASMSSDPFLYTDGTNTLMPYNWNDDISNAGGFGYYNPSDSRSGGGKSFGLPLQDWVTGYNHDGVYEIDWVTWAPHFWGGADSSYHWMISLVEGGTGGNTFQGGVSGNVGLVPSDNNLLRVAQFTVLGSASLGSAHPNCIVSGQDLRNLRPISPTASGNTPG